MNGWILALLVAAPIVLFLIWWLADEMIVDVETGTIGLLLVRGKPTDTVLEPGLHLVARLRRRTVASYPALEMSLRVGEQDGPFADDDLERGAPALGAVLGDRTDCTVSYTARFRIDRSALKQIHVRYGSSGLWSVARDAANTAVRHALLQPAVGVDDLFGAERIALEAAVSAAVSEALGSHGLELCALSLDAVDLGRAGESIQAAARARLELAREQAESEMRVERARRDAEVAGVLADVHADPALRYRETEAWRDLMVELARGPMSLPVRRDRNVGQRAEQPAAAERGEAEDPGALG